MVGGELGGDNELDDPFLIARQVAALARPGPTDTVLADLIGDHAGAQRHRQIAAEVN